MGKNETVQERHSIILNLLLEAELGQAIRKLGILCSTVPDWGMTSTFDSLNTTYGYMLQYFEKGIADESRTSMFRQLTAKAIILNDEVCTYLEHRSSMLLFHQTYRSLDRNSGNYGQYRNSLERFCRIAKNGTDTAGNTENGIADRILTDHETLLDSLFNDIWTSGMWDNEKCREICGLLKSRKISVSDRCLIISATTLSLLQRFDPQKFVILAELASDAETLVSARALTGLLLAASIYDNIIPYFPETVTSIASMAASDEIRPEVLAVQLALLLESDTDKVDRKIKDEIIPTLLREGSKMDKSGSSATTPEDFNPDWDGIMENSEIQKRIQEMTDLQMEGSDIYMNTFSNLKNYPFFRNVSGWFRIFEINQPDIRKSITGNAAIDPSVIQGFLASNLFCDSDKYSICLTADSIPEEQRRQIASQLSGQLDELKGIYANSSDRQSPIPFNTAVRLYIQDIYRFFKLFSRRHEFTDPFAGHINLFDASVLKPFTDDTQFERITAELLLKKRHYHDAAKLFGRLVSKRGNEGTDWQLWQKTGLSMQKSGLYGQAIDAYTKADILEPDNIWTLRHLASCYRESGHSERAIAFMLRAEELSPEDTSILLSTGELYMQTGQYNEAINRLFKASYLNPSSLRAKRDISWCTFLNGQYEKSAKHINEVLNDDVTAVTAQDLLNAGHIQWCTGNTSEAIGLYRQSLMMYGPDGFSEAFDKDSPLLLSRGISATDLSLMRDLLLG